jgi:hypothetical protein
MGIQHRSPPTKDRDSDTVMARVLLVQLDVIDYHKGSTVGKVIQGIVNSPLLINLLPHILTLN